MEHLEGSSLDVTMHDPGMRCHEEKVVGLALQLLTGLDELHKSHQWPENRSTSALLQYSIYVPTRHTSLW